MLNQIVLVGRLVKKTGVKGIRKWEEAFLYYLGRSSKF